MYIGIFLLGLDLLSPVYNQAYFTGTESTPEEFERIILSLIEKFKAPKPLIFSGSSNACFQGPLIFLDFDGVCWPFLETLEHAKFTKFRLNPKCIELLKKYEGFFKQHFDFRLCDKEFLKVACWESGHMKRILNLCQQFNARIVVTSNWRRDRNVTHLKNILELWGLGHYVIDKTADGNYSTCDTRAKQILEWQEKHGYKSKQFVVIDDGYTTELQAAFPGNFVHCNPLKGFEESDYLQAVNVLQSNAPKITSEAKAQEQTDAPKITPEAKAQEQTDAPKITPEDIAQEQTDLYPDELKNLFSTLTIASP